ncbi:MAG: hypothetical protein JW741_18285 [Sedimentisphaerales bacterium]|nr:hypothetical protein [Sedimentisphaerales bacterium]
MAVVGPDGSIKVLTEGFHSACDPEVSFDGTRLLFAGKRAAGDDWNIFEMNVDGSDLRQITRDIGDCRSPSYQSTLYTIISPKPWYQLTFVGSRPLRSNECGLGHATSLYSCKLDGSAVRRLTFNLSADFDPCLLPDGRVVFASWQRARLDGGFRGRIGLFGINIDGADCAAFCVEQGKRIKHMPCSTTGGLVVFVEADTLPWDGAGSLGSVTLRRPLHSYRPVTQPGEGLFHCPSPLPDGRILVSRRSGSGDDTHAVGVLDPADGRWEPVFDDPQWHDVQARAVVPRAEPDGRSSVVTEKDPNGKLYCLSVYINDLEDPQWLPRGSVKRVRILEGVAPGAEDSRGDADRAVAGVGPYGIPVLAQRRILSEVPVEEDGSFNVEIPADIPIELQILDADGMALRSCGWIWAKNHEPRGCIGCHEDGELTPENVFVDAAQKASVKLAVPPEHRRTVDFRRDVMPIIAARCAQCHGKPNAPVHLSGNLTPIPGEGGPARFARSYESLLDGAREGAGRYVHPGRARTSSLIWRLYGRRTSRPWDEPAPKGPVVTMPPAGAEPLREGEKRTFVEWIDTGALWDGIPEPEAPVPRSGDGGQ